MSVCEAHGIMEKEIQELIAAVESVRETVVRAAVTTALTTCSLLVTVIGVLL